MGEETSYLDSSLQYEPVIKMAGSDQGRKQFSMSLRGRVPNQRFRDCAQLDIRDRNSEITFFFFLQLRPRKEEDAAPLPSVWHIDLQVGSLPDWDKR